MEEILLTRLRLITDKLESLSEEAVDCLKCLDHNIDKAELVKTKLEMTVDRFTSELHNYFRLSQDPSADDISNFSTIQLKAEELFVELKVKLQKNNSAASITATPQDQNVMVSSRLPKLELAEFNGDILSWSTFWDQFSSNIDKRNLPDVDKLLYLKAALKGDAKRAIEGLETTNKNYGIAVTTLKERYGKQSYVIDAHYSALYKIKTSDNSVADCRNTLNEIERHLRVLNSLGEDINHNHMRFLILEKFPEEIIYEMKMRVPDDSIEEMRKHLEKIVTAREDANRITQVETKLKTYTVETLYVNERNKDQGISHQRVNKGHNYTKPTWSTKRFNEGRDIGSMSKKPRLPCVFCDGPHHSEDCTTVKTMRERRMKLRGKCYCCFGTGHIYRNCSLMRQCAHCKQRGHHVALCYNYSPVQTDKNGPLSPSTTTLHLSTKSNTILQTAIVKVMGPSSHSKQLDCRLLLDTGSQRSYVTQRVANIANLQIIEENLLSVFTFGSTKAQEIESPIVELTIETKTGVVRTLCANVVPVISQGIPFHNQTVNKQRNKIILADDGSLSDQVDILIGNDLYYSLISTEKVKINKNLFLINSELGWIFSGKLEAQTADVLSITYFQLSTENKLNDPDMPLDHGYVKSLWELESIGITDSPKYSRDEEAINNFNKTTQVIENRYTVSWPWTKYPPDLPTNYGIAYGRLVSLLKRLNKDTLSSYDKTLSEQIEKGIIEIVPTSMERTREHPTHYLPHHGVSQPDKPMRIVYDASAKVKDYKSLNECLYCGPLMLEELTALLLRFRSHLVGITADVEKAFLQIALHERDRDVTRFLWLKDTTRAATEDNLVHLRFCRVPFGVIASPFLLNATIRHHLMNSDKQLIKQRANDIYVDNLITGTRTAQEAISLYKDCKETFHDISMNLREWSSNSEEVVRNIPDKLKDKIVKVLGLDWDVERDILRLRLKGNIHTDTKRGVLKTIASIYDPCGFAVPSILPAKLFLQELWKTKLKWDTVLSPDLAKEWADIREKLRGITGLSVHRCYLNGLGNEDCQLHCFTDASMKAYAAVVYILHKNKLSFVIGKSRLVPIREQDNLKIPRLELLGALIGSRLIKFVLESLRLQISRQILWTDSQIVIEWCKSSKLLPHFVARRVDEIKKNLEMEIRHIPSKLNPADVATRPISSKVDKDIWLTGPQFLHKTPEFWPSELSTGYDGEPCLLTQDERSKKIEVDTASNTTLKLQEKLDHPIGLDLEEIKKIQTKYFSLEMQGKETNLRRNLDLFKDVDGVLRCKGRFTNTGWPYDKRYPILIPKDCEFTNNLIMKTHEDNYHVGANQTLSMVRENFWIHHGKSQVQKVIRKCPRCIKHGGGPFKLPTTPALPTERVNYSSPFTFVGIDYMGPVLVNDRDGNNKRWICLYTCLAVRAVHLEVVQDLTAEEGLLALRRMIATRGVPSLITSDNATHFKLMAEVLSNQYCIDKDIRWRFIPQLAPWFGGFYERLIGIVKNCMKRTLGKHLLSPSQLTTIIKEIEAVLNMRPLTCVDSEPGHILKPGDFLTMGRCITINASKENFTGKATTTKTDLIEAWKRGLMILIEFKDMFLNRYLLSLRERYRHSLKEPRITSKFEPKEGQIVQIKGEIKNRETWRVGKIISLQKGTDGICRVAKVKVGDREFIRSIAHLYPLEIEEDDIEDTVRETGQEPYCNNGVMESDLEPNCEQPDLEQLAIEHVEVEQPDTDLVIANDIEPGLVEFDAYNTQINFDSDTNDTRDLLNPEQVNLKGNDVEIDNPPGQSRPQRTAAQKALLKIKEWTRNLVTLA